MKPLLILSALQTLALLLVCHELNTANTAAAARQQALLQTLPAAIARAHISAQVEHESRVASLDMQERLRTLPPPADAAEARVRAALDAASK